MIGFVKKDSFCFFFPSFKMIIVVKQGEESPDMFFSTISLSSLAQMFTEDCE